MPVRALQQQAPTIQEERAMILELERAEAELLHDGLTAIGDTRRIEPWRRHIPPHGPPHHNGLRIVAKEHPFPVGCEQLNLQMVTAVNDNRVARHIDSHIGQIVFQHIYQTDRPVESAIQAEIGHVGGYHLHIAAVVATYGYRQLAVSPMGDVDGPPVVTTYVCSRMVDAHIDIRFLPRALEFEQSMSVGVRITDAHRSTVPRSPLIVVDRRVDTILGIITMGHAHFRPQRHALGLAGLHRTEHLPWTRHIGADELPSVRQARPDLCTGRKGQCTDEGQQKESFAHIGTSECYLIDSRLSNASR